MEKKETVAIRYKVEEETYQMKFYYACRQIRVTKQTIISTDKNFISYEWTDEDNYNEITERKIQVSIRRADERNNESSTEHSEMNSEPGQITESQHNLTDDEYELIEGFLNG